MWPFKRSAPETEERALSWLPWWDHAGDRPVGGTNSGAKVDERTALTFSAVWAAATLIADSVASLPAEATVNGKPADLPAWIRSPHLEMRSFDVWNQLVLSMVLWGNGYAQFVLRPSDGAPVGLTPIDPRRVTVEWNPNVPGTRRYKIDNGSWLTRKDIFHLQGPTLPGEPKGMSVIAQARESIGLGLTLEEFGARYFSQGSMAKIVLEVPGQVNEDRATGIVKVFEKFHRGKGNWHRPAIMSGGGKVHNISIPPDDAQFLQSREFQAMDVARWFRVPPHRIGIVSKQSSWGSGLAEENVAMVQHTFKPWILRLEQGLSAYAPGPEGLGMLIRLQDAGLLRGTTEEQDSHAITLYEAGLITKDEARAAIGKPPVGGKDGGFKEKVIPPALGGPPKAPDKQESQQGGPGPRDEDGKRFLAEPRHPGHANQKVHGRGGRLSEDQRDAITPGPGKTRAAARKALETSPEGRALMSVTDRWQNDMVAVSTLQKDFTARAGGKKLTKQKDEEVTALMDGIAKSGISPPIYRGVRMPHGFDPETALKPGTSFLLPPSSFSSSEKVADGFAKQKVTSAKKPVPVVYRVPNGGRALPIEVFGDSSYKSEKEWISAGQYKVTGVSKKRDGTFVVDVSHDAMYEW